MREARAKPPKVNLGQKLAQKPPKEDHMLKRTERPTSVKGGGRAKERKPQRRHDHELPSVANLTRNSEQALRAYKQGNTTLSQLVLPSGIAGVHALKNNGLISQTIDFRKPTLGHHMSMQWAIQGRPPAAAVAAFLSLCIGWLGP